MSVDHERYGRQIRLLEIGEAGQERLLASEVAAGGKYDAREVEVAYLVGAGVQVKDADAEVDAKAEAEAKAQAKALGVKDPAVREVADGAMRALLAMRRILGVG